ncbi:MAG: aminotransferase class I/II-fold pyridoxal phosphate-dependent enzyme [Chloroflexi bacterium]|nr:aminotransferase class I/II-fold pyridoxal phosphate-dependent enzyme [Chloroflexota bacterium]
MQSVQSPIIPVVGELIRRHPGTISLGQGVVYYGPPREAIEQLGSFLADAGNHKYKQVQGIPPLLEAITAKLAAENRIGLDASNALVVTAGGNMAFMNAILAITDPGDEIILQTPYYFNHEMAITMAGCRAVLVSTDDNYQLRPEAIRRAITPKTRAVVTISPNNPTGAVYPESALRDVNRICRDHGLYHIHDEAYEYFVYPVSAQARRAGRGASSQTAPGSSDEARHFSPGSIAGSSGHTISLFSLSKAYGFASWRIGYLVIPEHLLVSVKKIQDTVLICPPVISQYAAVGALQAGVAYCRAKLEAIADVRAIALEKLQHIAGFCEVPRAHGAFYFLLRLHTDWPMMELVEKLVREHRVAVIPGTTFGLEKGCYLRVAYGALERDTAVEGIGRLVSGLQAIVRG